MDINMVDVTLRLNQPIDAAQAQRLEDTLRALDGVISTHIPPNTRRVLLAEINPQATDAAQVLAHVSAQGIAAEVLVPDRL